MFENLKQKFKESKKQRGIRKVLSERIPVYCIFNGDPGKDETTGRFKDLDNHPPITFTATYEEAEEAVRKIAYYKYIDHFRNWAERKIDERDELLKTTTPPEDREKEKVFNTMLWVTYFVQVRSETIAEEFPIYCIPYTMEMIASIVRMATPTCTPLYMSYEDTGEITTYIQRHSDEKGVIQIPQEISHAMELDTDLRAEVQAAYAKAGADMVIVSEEEAGKIKEDHKEKEN